MEQDVASPSAVTWPPTATKPYPTLAMPVEAVAVDHATVSEGSVVNVPDTGAVATPLLPARRSL